MTVQEEPEKGSSSPHIKVVDTIVDPEVELSELRKELSDRKEAWRIEREDLLQQLERKNECLQAKDEELKLLSEKIHNQRVHKLVEINTLGQLVEESLSLAEHYRKQADKAKSEAQGNTLELQVLKSALEYARKEIHDLDETRNQLVGGYMLAQAEERYSKKENKLLYKALGLAESELQALRKVTSGESEIVGNQLESNNITYPELTSVVQPKISCSPNSVKNKAQSSNVEAPVFTRTEVDFPTHPANDSISVPLLKAASKRLFKVPSETDLEDKVALLPHIDPELDPVPPTPQPFTDEIIPDGNKTNDLETEENGSEWCTPDFSPIKKSDFLSVPPFKLASKAASPSSSDESKVDASEKSSLDDKGDTISSLNGTKTNLTRDLERGVTRDPWKESGALMKHVDPELEPEPLPNVLQHKDKESERIGHIRKLIGNFRRVKKSMAGIGTLNSSLSFLSYNEQMSMSSHIKSLTVSRCSVSEVTIDIESTGTPKGQSPSLDSFSSQKNEVVDQEEEILEESSERVTPKEPSEFQQSDTENVKPRDSEATSEQALNELSELQSGTNGKLIVTKTNISNLQRRITFLANLSLGFFDKSRLDDIKKQLVAAQAEISRMKETNKNHIEKALSLISKNSTFSEQNDDTIAIIEGAKRNLTDVKFLTELDVIAFTLESIGDEVSRMELKELGRDGKAETANIATETDLNFLEEMLRVSLASHKSEEVMRMIDRTKDSFERVENCNSSLRYYLNESRKVIFKQTKEIRNNSLLLEKVNEHAENLSNENKTIQEDRLRAEEELKQTQAQFLLEKTTLIERVSEEMHRLRCMG